MQLMDDIVIFSTFIHVSYLNLNLRNRVLILTTLSVIIKFQF